MCFFKTLLTDALIAHDPRCYTYMYVCGPVISQHSAQSSVPPVVMLIRAQTLLDWFGKCGFVSPPLCRKGAEGRMNPLRFKFISWWIIYRMKSQWFPMEEWGGAITESSSHLNAGPNVTDCPGMGFKQRNHSILEAHILTTFPGKFLDSAIII